jgi:GNAT superfamily N-acetyltransferase
MIERLVSTGLVTIEPLASHPEVLPVLEQWFETEWPSYYGAGGLGSARLDLQTYSNRSGLPVAVVVFCDGAVCGVMALKASSIASHSHLSPWAAAGLVKASARGHGLGAQLLAAIEREARALGFPYLYSGTSTAETLLRRGGWQLMERINHEGQDLGIYCKAL